jgi:hypothetical protein
LASHGWRQFALLFHLFAAAKFLPVKACFLAIASGIVP